MQTFFKFLGLVSDWLGAGTLLALANLQAATEVVDARVGVDVVVDGVGVALAIPLGGGGGGGGGLDRGYWLPHSHVCPISKGLDCITYRWKVVTESSAESNIFWGRKEGKLGCDFKGIKFIIKYRLHGRRMAFFYSTE